jgi:hypothetical protein
VQGGGHPTGVGGEVSQAERDRAPHGRRVAEDPPEPVAALADRTPQGRRACDQTAGRHLHRHQQEPEPVEDAVHHRRQDAGRRAEQDHGQDEGHPAGDLTEAQAIDPQVIGDPRDDAQPDRSVVEHVGDEVQSLEVPKRQRPKGPRRDPEGGPVEKEARERAPEERCDHARVRPPDRVPVAPLERGGHAPGEQQETEGETEELNDEPPRSDQGNGGRRLPGHAAPLYAGRRGGGKLRAT